jgi:hypothetical protein
VGSAKEVRASLPERLSLEPLFPTDQRDTYGVDLFVAFLAVFFTNFAPFAGARAFMSDDALTLPITATAPAPGARLDSSPVDHLMPRSCPTTPVTTP